MPKMLPYETPTMRSEFAAAKKLFRDWRHAMWRNWKSWWSDLMSTCGNWCSNRWTDLCDIVEHYALGIFMILFVGGLTIAAITFGPSVAAWYEAHSDSPVVAQDPSRVPPPAATYDFAGLKTALEANQYTAVPGPKEKYAPNGCDGIVWRTSDANAPMVVLCADGITDPLVAQVRASDNSFWCSTPQIGRDNLTVALRIYSQSQSFKTTLPHGDQLPFTVNVDGNQVRVVCGRA